MTCDMRLVTCDTSFFLSQKVQENSQKSSKKLKELAKKCPKVQKSVKKVEFLSITAIRARQESRCLPYAGFLGNSNDIEDYS